MRVGVICRAGLTSFIGDLLRHWDSKYETSYFEPTGTQQDALKIHAIAGWSDVLFCEWADGFLQVASHFGSRAPIVTRLHGYEAFSDLSGINWSNVHILVTAARHKADLVRGQIGDSANIKIVRYGVNTDKYQIPPDKQYPKSLIHAGLMNYRKGYDFALLALYELLRDDPDWTLTFVRTVQDSRYQWAMYEMAKNLGIEDNVVWKERVPDLNEEFSKHSIVLSTSIEESFHYTLAEGMAAGLLPLCRDWPEARDLWPPGVICKTPLDMACECARWWEECGDKAEGSRAMRGWIEEHFGLDRQFAEMDAILEQAAADGKNVRTISLMGPPVCKKVNPYDVYFSLIPPGSNILEWNCGAGRFLQEAMKRGDKVIGVEEQRPLLERARENTPGAMILDRVMAATVEPRNVEYIVTSNLGENAGEALRWIRTRLAPGGRAILSLANAAFGGEPLPSDGVCERMDSLRGWTELIASSGLFIDSVIPYNGPWAKLPDDSCYRFVFMTRTKPELFAFQGDTYPYFYHAYNRAYMNDRTWEVPVGQKLVRECGGDVLEVGNVLGHYGPIQHTVLDKYEQGAGIVNEDAETFQGGPYDLIVSISTIEHIGWDEERKDPDKVIRALDNLKALLKPGGKLVITFPLGYNPPLDSRLESGALGFSETYYMKRISQDNQWKEATWDEVKGSEFGKPFNNGNGDVIGVYVKGGE